MPSAKQLVTELNNQGVHFLTGGDVKEADPVLSPTELLAGLSTQPEVRLRLAVIPLFLYHPQFAKLVPDASIC